MTPLRRRLQTAQRFCDRAERCADRASDLVERTPARGAAVHAKLGIQHLERARQMIVEALGAMPPTRRRRGR